MRYFNGKTGKNTGLFRRVAHGALAAIIIYASLSTEVAATDVSQQEGNIPDASSTVLSTAITTHTTGTPVAAAAETPASANAGKKEAILHDDDDVEAFLQQLLAEEETEQEEKHDEQPPKQQLTEEEIAEQKRLLEIETKEKRADITGRHTKWEEKLRVAGKAKVAEMLITAREMREEVVAKMRTSPEMFDLVKKMQEAGMKQVEGAERVLQKMVDSKENDEAGAKKWNKVVEKIQQKLNARTIDTTEYLQTWFNDVMAKEKKLFEAAAEEIHQIADDGQADIGMDYAWLDDVKPSDWTRYHQLKKDAKKFVEELETIFNAGYGETEGDNVIVKELLQVEAAAVRVAADLNAALDKLKKGGLAWLKGEEEVTTSASPSSDAASSSSTLAPPSETEEAEPAPVEEVKGETLSSVAETPASTVNPHVEL